MILLVALGMGIFGDLLLRQTPWGLNVLLFNLAFVAGFLMLAMRRRPDYLTTQTIALLCAQIFFAAMFVWRDAGELLVADAMAIIAILSVLFVPRMNVAQRVAGVVHFIVGFIWSSLNAWFAAAALLTVDIDWKAGNRSTWAKHVVAVLRGLLLVAPIVFVFGALFAAADARFAEMVERVFNIPPEFVFTHGILIALFSWLTAGYLRGIFLSGEAPAVPATETATAEAGTSKVDQVRDEPADNSAGLPDGVSILEHINKSDPPDKKEETAKAEETKDCEEKRWQWARVENTLLPEPLRLGAVEVGVILGALNLLFLAFVIIQLPYLFGGMELVQNTAGLKLADYARRGFGELVVVSALVLPVLLASHWMVRGDSIPTQKLFRVLAGIQIGLLFVIMASAAQRLMLLTGELGYGLTTVRLYPMIFMIWIAVVFVWFAVTVLRGRRQYFAWGALWSAFFVLGGAHMLNPDDFIVRTNVSLMNQGREFDTHYNSNLSADSVPALLSALPQMKLEDQCVTKVHLHISYRGLGETNDIRSLNWSRKSSWYLLNRNDSQLHQVDGCPERVRSNLALDRESSE